LSRIRKLNRASDIVMYQGMIEKGLQQAILLGEHGTASRPGVLQAEYTVGGMSISSPELKESSMHFLSTSFDLVIFM